MTKEKQLQRSLFTQTMGVPSIYLTDHQTPEL